MRLVRALSTALALVLLAAPRGATAAPTAASDEAGRLFERGKALMSEGNAAEACKALQRSQELDPADGTQLALGLCHEQEGRSVLAYNELARALARAIASGREDRQRVARSALLRLQTKVGRLTLRLEGRGEGVTVLRDGQLVPAEALGLETALEGGSHGLELRRGSQVLWAENIDVASGAALLVVIPASPERPAAPRPEPEKPKAALRDDRVGEARDAPILAYTVGGIGLASLAVGGIFGVRAFNGWSDVTARCTPSACTDPSARDSADSARASATASNIFFLAGAALVTTSVVLLLMRPASAAHVARR